MDGATFNPVFLIYYRQQARMTQAQLAIRAQVHWRTVSNAETGRHVPSLDVLFRLAKVLNVPVERLLR